jgi:hypothetical protein
MTTVTFSRVAALTVGVGLLSVLAGCSDSNSKVDVTGKITWAGKEPNIHGLQIVFLGMDGSTIAAGVGVDGTYQAAAVSTGEAKVYFSAMTQDQFESAAQVKGPRLQKPGGVAATPKAAAGNFPKTNPLPMHLRDPLSSKLTVQIAGGKPNTFDYDIK